MRRAGMLQSGEITIDEVIDRAETFDEWSEVDLYMAMNVLHALRSEREQPFANIAFFLADAETDESDAAKLGTEHHAVPFVLYRKNLPGGLIEALARILTSADDPRRFVWDNFDSFLSVSYLTPAQTSMVNSAEREKFPRFEEVA